MPEEKLKNASFVDALILGSRNGFGSFSPLLTRSLIVTKPDGEEPTFSTTIRSSGMLADLAASKVVSRASGCTIIRAALVASSW